MKNLRVSLQRVAMFLTILAFIAACNKKPKQLNYIPKEASVVVSIDAKKLAVKSLELKDILNADIFKAGGVKDSIADKVKNSGIDLLNTAYIFGDVAKGEEKSYVAVVFALDDESKFEKTIKEAGKTEVQTDNDVKFAYINNTAVGWKDKVGLFVYLDNETDKEKAKAKLKALFAQKEENSLVASNEKFKSLLKEEADLSVWVNYEKIGDFVKQNSAAMASTTANLKDTYLAATLNFDKGKIVSDLKMYNNEENTKKAKELYKAAVSKELINSQPGGDVVALMSFGINTEPVIKYLQEAGLLEGINANLKALGPDFDANYVASALSGEFIATINALRVQEVNKPDYVTGKMTPQKDLAIDYAVTIGLKDAAKFQKLLDAVATQGALVKKDKYYAVGNMAYIIPKANYLTVAGGEAFALDLVNDKKTALDSKTADLLASNTMAFAVDISKVKPEVIDLIGPDAKKMSETLPIESFVLSAEEVKSEVVTAEAVIVFKNKEQNSLISLQQSLKEASKYLPSTTYDQPTASSDSVSVEVDVVEEVK